MWQSIDVMGFQFMIIKLKKKKEKKVKKKSPSTLIRDLGNISNFFLAFKQLVDTAEIDEHRHEFRAILCRIALGFTESIGGNGKP